MKQGTRITLVCALMILIGGGIVYLVGIFPPPSDTRCFAPGGSFYVALNEDGSFSRIK